MPSNSFTSGIAAKVDSSATTELFHFFFIHGFTKSWLDRKHCIWGRIGLNSILALAVAAPLWMILVAAGFIDFIFFQLKRLAGIFRGFELKVEVRMRAQHAMVLVLLVLLAVNYFAKIL